MKKYAISFWLSALLLFPQVGGAQVTDPEERRYLLALVAELQAQINILIELLEVRKAEEMQQEPGAEIRGEATSQTHTLRSSKQKNYKHISISGYQASEFRNGPYVALYLTNGYDLSSITGGRVDSDFEEAWEMFVEIAGEDLVREKMSEFRVYVDKDAAYDAFIDQIGENNTWVLGVNFYNLDLTERNTRDWLEELLLHEYGHVLFHNKSIVDDFRNMFWDAEDLEYARKVANTTGSVRRDDLVLEYYERHRNDFVTTYAATSPLEDLIESFTHFVLEGSASVSTKADRKINFFRSHTWVVDVAERIRRTL